MRFYKIKVGYETDGYVSIDETELEMALHIFLTEGKGVFKNGVVRGKDIITIKEDWHKAMGINPEWKLTSDDHNEMSKRGITREYQGKIEEARNRVKYFVETEQQSLIGTNVKVPLLFLNDRKKS